VCVYGEKDHNNNDFVGNVAVVVMSSGVDAKDEARKIKLHHKLIGNSSFSTSLQSRVLRYIFLLF